MEQNNINTNSEKFTPKNIQSIFALIIAIIGVICHTVMMFTGMEFSDTNVFLKILILLGCFILLFIVGCYFFDMFFFGSIEAYEKDLPNKKQIFLINLLLFWTVIVPFILYFYVSTQNKKNSFTDD